MNLFVQILNRMFIHMIFLMNSMNFNQFDFFNFKEISITTNNMESAKKRAEDLKIDFVINSL